ncbi:MAG: molybdenum cofactor guanylyltransferase [Thermoplasmata archaeon]
MIAVIFVKRSERFPGKHSAVVNGSGLTEGLARKLGSLELFDQVIIFSKDPSFRSGYGGIERDNSEGTIVNSVFNAVSIFGDIFAFAGDMPAICPDLIRNMMKAFDGRSLCPVTSDGKLQTLHCIYSSSILPDFGRYIAEGGRSLHGFVERNANLINVPPDRSDCFLNINYPADLEKYLSEKSKNPDGNGR